MEISFGKIDFRPTASLEEAGGTPDDETPFRLLVIGDFSGRENRGQTEAGAALAGRKPLVVDRDNFDDVFRRLDVRFERLKVGKFGLAIPLRFGEFDDLHPDRLVAQVNLFQSLRDTRRQLQNPASFNKAAAEVSGWSQRPSAAPAAAPPASIDNLFDAMISATEERPAEKQATSLGDLNSLVQQIVGPFLVPRPDPRQDELLASVDQATSATLRGILHHPQFQALEAAWRGLQFLIRRLETDTLLKVYVLDLSRAELALDLGAGDDLAQSGLYKLLVEQTLGTPGGLPWGAVVGNFTFGPGADDAQLLGRISQIAAQAGAPFLAGACPGILGCESLVNYPDPDDWTVDETAAERAAWNALRRLPSAKYVGLALPRLLLRYPYGAKTEPVETFAFEELPDNNSHERYLWGAAAWGLAALLGDSFTRSGWELRPGEIQELDGFPLHVYEEAGERIVKPCAEVLLTQRAAERILEAGVMPFLSFRGGDTVRLGRFQSIAAPLAPLAGRWGS